MGIKRLIKKILGLEKKLVEYRGNFSSFAEAEKFCEGYDSDVILEKVKQGTMAVVNGKAAFERDSFLFYEKEINYNLMMYLYRIYIKDGYLNVCDWGGALGSTFLQHKDLLAELSCRWNILEQKHFIEFGKANIKIEGLSFRESLHDREEGEKYNCILFSGVLQYLENVWEIINLAMNEKPGYIILERTPVSDCSRIWIENVHEPIYEASYACRVFDEKELTSAFLTKGYNLIDSWHSLVDVDEKMDKDHKVEFKSFVFQCT